MATSAADAGTISGQVFLDLDGDGALGPGDPPLEGVEVFFDTAASARTDESGAFVLEAPDRPGIAWARAPEGATPGPHWFAVDASGDDLSFALSPAPASPLSFVVGSDTHAGIADLPAEDLRTALVQATDMEPAPHFLVLTGDMTSGNEPEQFAMLLEAAAAASAPLVPVPGNHDWYDGGAEYRRTFGPPTYSFDAGGVHFAVLNDSAAMADSLAFLDRDLASVDEGRLVVAFVHAPPGPDVIDELLARGVDYLFTGHLHANRIHQHAGLIEYNTQPLAMGGIDLSPAGYRVVSLSAGGGALTHYHRTTVNEPVVELVYPRPGDAVAGCEFDALVSVEHGAGSAEVSVTLGRQTTRLDHLGGWSYRGRIGSEGSCRGGREVATIEVVTSTGARTSRSADICRGVGELAAAPGELADWPELCGGPERRCESETELAPPLTTVWASAVGGTVHGGAPVVAEGRVLVPLADFGDGDEGGVVALDLRTGAELWRHRAGFGVRSAPVVSDGTVVFGSVDGTVHAVDAASGELRWTYRLGEGLEPQVTSFYASPAVQDGLVFAGIQRELVALDRATGEPVWTVVPRVDKGWYGSSSSPALAAGLLLSSFSGGDLGLQAYDSATGELVWSTPRAVTASMHAPPVVAGSVVYAINAGTMLRALDLFSGDILWEERLVDGAESLSYGATAAPAYAGGLLYVGTQHGALYAVDAATGIVEWTHLGGESAIRTVHYRGRAASFFGEPVVTGGVLWTAGADGVLVALDRRTGARLWEDDLQAPVTAGLAAAGELLVVAGHDGVVRALGPGRAGAAGAPDCAGPPRAEEPEPEPEPEPPSGCACSAGDAGAGPLLSLLVLAGAWRRRRARG